MNKFDFLHEEKFLNAYNNKYPEIFLNMPMPEISWQEVLSFINNYPEKRVGKKIVTGENSFFYNDPHIIPSVNSFVKQVHSLFTLGHEDPITLTSQMFATVLLQDGMSIVRHQDSENNLFWQGKGQSRWKLYESYETEKPFIDIILEENDIIYVPSHTIHYVEPITPRFAFAVLFDHLRSE